MVSAGTRTLNLVLPEIKTAGSNQLEDRIIVSVDSLGNLLYNNTSVSQEQFSETIKFAGTCYTKTSAITDQETSSENHLGHGPV